jgi:hypothetical protein
MDAEEKYFWGFSEDAYIEGPFDSVEDAVDDINKREETKDRKVYIGECTYQLTAENLAEDFIGTIFAFGRMINKDCHNAHFSETFKEKLTALIKSEVWFDSDIACRTIGEANTVTNGFAMYN